MPRVPTVRVVPGLRPVVPRISPETTALAGATEVAGELTQVASEALLEERKRKRIRILNETDLAVQRMLNDLRLESQQSSDPDFQDQLPARAEEGLQKILGGIEDDRVREAAATRGQQSVEAARVGFLSRGAKLEDERRIASFEASLDADAEAYERADSYAEGFEIKRSSLSRIALSPDLSDAEKIATREAQIDRMAALRANRMIAEDPVRAVEELEDPGAAGFQGMKAETRQKALSLAKRAVQGEVAKHNARVELDFRIRAKGISPDTAEGFFSELQSLHERNVIGNEDFISIGVQMANDLEGFVDSRDRTSDIIRIIEGGSGTVDMTDSKNRKAYDRLYTEGLKPLLDSADPEERLQLEGMLVRSVSRLGVFPETLEGELKNALAGSNAEAVGRAASMIQKVKAENEVVVPNTFTEKEMLRAEVYANRVRGGATPEQALADAIKVVPRELRDTLRKEFGNLTIQTQAEKFFESQFGESSLRSLAEFFLPKKLEPALVGLDAKPPRLMFEEFYANARELYATSEGDLESSLQTAAANLQRVWGLSEIGAGDQGVVWAKRIPEKEYGNGVDPIWMQEQLLTDTRQALDRLGEQSGIPAETLATPDEDLRDRVFLSQDPQTAYEPQGAVRYTITLRDDVGRFWPLQEGPGQVLYWHPDWESSPERARQQEAKRSKIEEAEERIRQLAENPESFWVDPSVAPELQTANTMLTLPGRLAAILGAQIADVNKRSSQRLRERESFFSRLRSDARRARQALVP